MASISITFIILNSIILWDTTQGLTGYYCGKLPLEIAEVSLLDVRECTTQGTVVVILETYLQFLRVSQNDASTDDCHFDRYNVLHEGMGKIFVDINSTYPPIFAGIMKNFTFALRSTGQRNVCDRTMYTTEYPELLIFETSKKSSFPIKRKTATDHVDIFAYVNKKFIYPNVILKNIETQKQLLYHDVLLQECYIERENMKHVLAAFISRTISPDIFAYNLMKVRGYTAMAKGEVGYIIKCVPVQITIRETKYCYNELPVSFDNHNFFLTPVTRILIYNGTMIDCYPKIPVKFFIDNKWYEMLPNPKIDEIETTESIATLIWDSIFSSYNVIVTLGHCYCVIALMIIFRRWFCEIIII